MARVGGARGRLVTTQVGTRRTSLVGSSFLTGVDRRVHAPLGTVMNFSGLVVRTSGRYRGHRCTSVIRRGSAILLGLFGSVLSLSTLRTNSLRLSCRPIELGSVYLRLCRLRIGSIGPRIQLILSRMSSRLYVRKS